MENTRVIQKKVPIFQQQIKTHMHNDIEEQQEIVMISPSFFSFSFCGFSPKIHKRVFWYKNNKLNQKWARRTKTSRGQNLDR